MSQSTAMREVRPTMEKANDELTVQEKDITMQWGGRNQLLYVSLKQAKSQEVWHNNQVTDLNIKLIRVLHVLRKGTTLRLELRPEDNGYRFLTTPKGKYRSATFAVATAINKTTFKQIISKQARMKGDKNER